MPACRCAQKRTTRGSFCLSADHRLFCLVGRLGYLQVVRGKNCHAGQNKTDPDCSGGGTAGAIYDRYGRELVTNRAAFTVSLLKLDPEQTERSIRNVSTILGLSPSEIAERIERQSKKMGVFLAGSLRC